MKTLGLDLLVRLTGASHMLRIMRIIAAVFITAWILNPSLHAAYLKNVPQTITQPDGRILNCFATGDEYHHWLHDVNDFTILQDSITGFYVYAMKSGSKLVPSSFVAGTTDPARVGLQPGLNLDVEEVQLRTKEMFRIPALKGGSGVTTSGTINNIVIFIRFSDQAEYTDPVSKYNLAFNAAGSVSMAEYFKQVSGSQLTVKTSMFPEAAGSTVVSYQDAMARSYYCKYNSAINPDGYQNETERSNREMTLLKNATEAVSGQIESTGLNYDSDNNGQIDNVCFIVQGSTDGWAELLWPHMWALYAYNVTIGGVKVWNFNFQIEQTFGVSVLCHEMSHTLGFPDLYRYTNRTINPVGPWDIMSSFTNPPQHQSVYTKQKYGNWISGIPEITTNGTYTLNPLSTDPFAAFKIISPNSSTEYFMVEYRKTAGMFESQLLGSGLIVYRVAPANNGNCFGPPDEVYVCRPNGTTTVDGNLAEAFFSSDYGRASFGATSNPTCFLSDGSSGGFQITNIGTAGETISFVVSFGNSIPASVLSIDPVSREAVVSGSSTSFAVTNTGGGTMSWSAAVTTGGNWAHITSVTNGSNSGSIIVSVDANPESSPRTATITVTAADAAGSPKTLTVSQAANESILAVTPDSRSLPLAGGSESFAITNTGGGTMSWSAAVTAGGNWAHLTSGASGSNSGSIEVSVDANPDSSPRTATVTVTAADAAGSQKTLSVYQAANGSILAVSPDSRSLPLAGGSESFAVSNIGGGTMSWTAAVTAGANWAHITAGANGSNSGSITVTVDTNPESSPRTATISVIAADAAGSPKTLTVYQAANGSVLVVSPDSRSLPLAGGSESFAVSNIGGGTMSWSAAVTAGGNWAHITSGSSGSNSGSIEVTVDANPESSPRTATITVTAADAAGSPKTLTVYQAANGSILAVTPDSRSLPLAGGSESFAVSNIGGGTMSWSATVTAGGNWAHITSGSSGSNSGSIEISIDPTPESSPRTAVITLTASDAAGSPKTLTVYQAANGSILAVSPDSRSLPLVGGSVSFAVTNIGGGTMSWSAAETSGANWAHIAAGANGSNSGSIIVSVDANPESSSRTAVITVTAADAAGSPKTLTVYQAANGSMLAVSPDSRNLTYTAGFESFVVSNVGGGTMSWTAAVTTGTSWVHILAGSNGSNEGVIIVSLDANPESSPRTAIIAVTNSDAAGSQKTLTISQAANGSVLTVTPGSRNLALEGGNESFAVSNTGGGNMRWSAAVSAGGNWVHITSGSTGSNAGSIEVFVDANPDSSARTAVITVTASDAAGSPKTLTISQAANGSMLNVGPEKQNVAYRSSTVTFEVSNTGGGAVGWTAAVTKGNSWAHIISGSKGSNAGSILVEVGPNTGMERTATIAVTTEGKTGKQMTVNIVQELKTAELEIDPDIQTVDFDGAEISFGVSKTGIGTIGWIAEVTSGLSWVHITSGTSGSNEGLISLQVDKNTGEPRTAIIIVTSTDSAASQKTLTINQDISSGIGNPNIENKFNAYPNPIERDCTVQIEEFSGTPQKLEIFNILGQLESYQSLNQERTVIDMAGLQQGVYLLRVTSENNIISQRRVFKN